MTIRNLEIFLEVAKSRSMSHTASRLHISQPTVSHAISSLEQEYNTQLFDRSSHQLLLTPAGEILVQESQNVMQALIHLKESMASSHERSTIRIGVSVTVSVSILDTLTEQFRRRYPQIQVQLLISHTSDVEAALENHKIDLAIVSGEIHNSLIETVPIIQDYQVCIGRSDHPLAKETDVTLKQLVKEKFVMLLGYRWTRETFENYVHDKGYSIQVVCECSNTGLVKERVLKGYGITVISARVVEKELRDGRLARIRCPECFWERPFILAHRKQKYLPQPLKEFIRIAKSYTDNSVLQLL